MNNAALDTGHMSEPHDYDGHLVRFRANLAAFQVATDARQPWRRLLLNRDGSIFSALLLAGDPKELDTLLPGSELEVTGIVQLDYTPVDESVRIRPPEVSNVHISNLRVSDVQTPTGKHSCFQAFVILGPVAGTYNGPAGKPTLPLDNITITNCDFGTPRNAEQPWFAYNVKNLVLTNVKIAGKAISKKIDA